MCSLWSRLGNYITKATTELSVQTIVNKRFQKHGSAFVREIKLVFVLHEWTNYRFPVPNRSHLVDDFVYNGTRYTIRCVRSWHSHTYVHVMSTFVVWYESTIWYGVDIVRGCAGSLELELEPTNLHYTRFPTINIRHIPFHCQIN